jgi:hypothetical protein
VRARAWACFAGALDGVARFDLGSLVGVADRTSAALRRFVAGFDVSGRGEVALALSLREPTLNLTGATSFDFNRRLIVLLTNT